MVIAPAKPAFVLPLILILVALSACSGAPTPKPSLGALELSISGLPTGVSASVSVSGPGFSQSLSASKTLSGLAPGLYSVSPASVTSSGVSYSASITGSPATVVAGATATVRVVYAAQPAPTPPAPPPAQTGSLQVSVSGLPGGLAAKVSVSGPEGFSQALTGSKTLEGLKPGSYTLTASEVSQNGATYTASLSGSPATVSAGNTARVSVTYASQPGSLLVRVSGLPPEVKPDITLSGPGGFSQTLTAAMLLKNLEPGTYTLTPKRVRGVAPVADLIFEGAPRSVTVQSGGAATGEVTYLQRPGTATLWLPLITGAVIGYKARNLGFGSNSLAAPDVTLGTGFGSSAALAFDAQGNMWLLNSITDSLLELTPAALAGSGSPAPSVSIGSSAGSLNRPVALAFDTSGNLWIANLGRALGEGTLVMYTPAQLAHGGSPTPSVRIDAPVVASLSGPGGLAFDASGNLWVLNTLTPKTLVKFTPAQLAQSGSPQPATTLSLQLNTPTNIGFDPQGSLWISDSGANQLVRFTPSQLSQGGNLAPATVLAASGGSLNYPAGLAFDSSGNLWVANLGNHTLVQFTPDQLSSGAPSPTSTISDIGNLASGSIAFDPPPLHFIPPPPNG